MPLSKQNAKSITGAVVFFLVAIGVAAVAPNAEIAWVCAILLLTIYLFVFEVVGVDVAATSIMVLLGLTTVVAQFIGLDKGLVKGSELFSGFSSNAVISIIAVMIIGSGLDKTGIMSKVAAFILRVGGSTEKRIIPVISSTVGLISSFMQNVGAAALFLPVVSRISARTGLPMSRLLMPMGFCAILGGTITMVGSSPLILLNDLILTSNKALPPEHQMHTWAMFSVTPIGLVLVTTGILYFIVIGRFILPANKSEGVSATSAVDYFKETYGLDYDLNEVVVLPDSSLIGKALDDFEKDAKVRVVTILGNDSIVRIGPENLGRHVAVEAGSVLGVMGSPKAINALAQKHQLQVRKSLESFVEPLAATKAGVAELVVPPRSNLVGKSPRDLRMRQTYGLSLLALHRGGETFRAGEGVRDKPMQAGDVLVVHTTWDALARLETDRNFVVMTAEYPHEELRPHKVNYALLFLVVALFLVLAKGHLFPDIPLSVALLTGAIGMVLTGVLTIEEAYDSVSWKTVFLLASLIPLGVAVNDSGTAKWIADQTLSVVGDMPLWVIQSAVAVLGTFFTLVMSNVGATVLLVPLAVNIAIGAGGNPAIFALTVAISTSNSFFIPTHQVNALIMGPGGYRVPDFMKAGGIMTILFLIVSITMLNVVM